jgi:hypothetical protein
MAELVLGVGTSHSPMLGLDAAGWLEWGQRDRTSPHLVDEIGRYRTWDDRVEEVGDAFVEHLAIEHLDQLQQRTQAAMDDLARQIEAARLDAIIVVGDDQDEHLLESNLPPLLVYWGASVVSHKLPVDDAPAIVQQFRVNYYESEVDHAYPVDVDLARTIIDEMLDRSIDVSSSRSLPIPDRTLGHAFAFPLIRLIPRGTPVVPVMINTYNPPSQPRAARCIDYGDAIRAAVDRFDGGRIGVLASGGLSHMLVLRDLDEMVIEAFTIGDLGKLTAIPEDVYRAGTSEIKNWIAVAASCRDMTFDLVDYVPGYRSRAGSGVGLAFATWR